MKCPSCTADAPADSVFCPKCGVRLVEAPPSEPQTAADKFRETIKNRSAAAADDVERELWHGGFSPKAMVGYWFGTLLGSVGLIMAGAYLIKGEEKAAAWTLIVLILLALWGGMILYYLYQRYSIDYQLTNQRLVHRRGLFSRMTNRVEVIDIDDVRFEQNFVERLLGIGTIHLLSSDISDPRLTMRGIENVKEVAKQIDDVRRQERRKRGLHIETV